MPPLTDDERLAEAQRLLSVERPDVVDFQLALDEADADGFRVTSCPWTSSPITFAESHRFSESDGAPRPIVAMLTSETTEGRCINDALVDSALEFIASAREIEAEAYAALDADDPRLSGIYAEATLPDVLDNLVPSDDYDSYRMGLTPPDGIVVRAWRSAQDSEDVLEVVTCRQDLPERGRYFEGERLGDPPPSGPDRDQMLDVFTLVPHDDSWRIRFRSQHGQRSCSADPRVLVEQASLQREVRGAPFVPVEPDFGHFAISDDRQAHLAHRALLSSTRSSVAREAPTERRNEREVTVAQCVWTTGSIARSHQLVAQFGSGETAPEAPQSGDVLVGEPCPHALLIASAFVAVDAALDAELSEAPVGAWRADPAGLLELAVCDDEIAALVQLEFDEVDIPRRIRNSGPVPTPDRIELLWPGWSVVADQASSCSEEVGSVDFAATLDGDGWRPLPGTVAGVEEKQTAIVTVLERTHVARDSGVISVDIPEVGQAVVTTCPWRTDQTNLEVIKRRYEIVDRAGGLRPVERTGEFGGSCMNARYRRGVIGFYLRAVNLERNFGDDPVLYGPLLPEAYSGERLAELESIGEQVAQSGTRADLRLAHQFRGMNWKWVFEDEVLGLHFAVCGSGGAEFGEFDGEERVGDLGRPDLVDTPNALEMVRMVPTDNRFGWTIERTEWLATETCDEPFLQISAWRPASEGEYADYSSAYASEGDDT